MSAHPRAFNALIWVPSYVGFTIAAVSYGATIGQLAFYVWAFSRDKLLVKVLVFIVFILNSVHMFLITSVVYRVLIHCRMDASPGCVVYAPWALMFSTCARYLVTFMVQVFYAHRVWIISGHNRVITFVVVASATAQLAFGLVVIDEVIRTPTFGCLSSSKYTPLCALATAICDAVITSSVFYYLRPGRTGVTRRGNMINRLNFVFVQMGSLSFINALAMVIFYYIQDHRLGRLTAAPGIILSNIYVNSMLAVLNARKSIRDQHDHPTAIEVPTIPTIY